MKGTIRVRTTKDGRKRYTCQVSAGIDPRTGKRRFLTGTASSEREAHKVLHRLITEVDSGVVSRERATLSELIAAWLEAAGPQGEGTRLVYFGYIRKHIDPGIGKMPAAKLRVEDLDRWYAGLKKAGLAPASIRKLHNIVRGALTQGVKWGWVSTNVARQSSPPSVPKSVVATPSPSSVGDFIRLISDVDADLACYIRLSAVTGARPGEMCGLRWRDIAWDKGEIAIERRIVRAEPEHIVKDLTKTGKTRRVPIDAGTMEFLRAHRIRYEERAAAVGIAPDDDSYVFSDAADNSVFWQQGSVSRRFRTLRSRAGLEGVPLYSLRHQAATALIDLGIDPKTVADRLGNSVATVLGTYTRARSEADRSAGEMMGNLLDP